jgi:hypothetical protein
MPITGTQKTHRVPVMMSDKQFDIIARIRKANPQYHTNTDVVIAAVVRLAQAEGVPIG